MKDFIKMFFASCLGVMVGLLLLGLILMAIGGSIASSNSKLKTDGVLVLDFKEHFLEKTGNLESDIVSGPKDNIGLRDFTKLINKAKEDSKIKGILIKDPSPNVGQASLYSILHALKDFKSSDKFIYAYSDYYTQGGYFLSSVADSIFMNPNGLIDVRGYSTMIPFFKNGMDKLGVSFDIFYAGDFKSATESFRRTDMSDENRLQTKEFLGEMLDIMVAEVASNRNLTASDFDNIFSNFEGQTPESSLSAGLIDKISYWNDVETLIKSKVGKADDKKLKYTSLMSYKKHNPRIEKGPSSSKIAIVYAEGTVGYGEHSKGSITDQEYIKIFSKIRRDKKIKAVVLRVNSGGGSALTSDIIWDEIEKTKAIGKPVIASFGDYAASGGYYIAAGADTIVSQPNTLTGSIGVFSMLPKARKLLEDKLGITFDTVQTHSMAVGYTGYFDLSPAERMVFEKSTNRIYETFLKRVGDGRNMTRDEVHAIAQGRVWTGTKGKEIGLVDVLGDLDVAIEIAAEKAGLDEHKIVEYPFIKVDPFEQIIQEFMKGMDGGEDALVKLSKQNKHLYELVKFNKELLEAEGPQARLMFKLEY